MSKFGHSVGKGWLANIVKAGFDTITVTWSKFLSEKKLASKNEKLADHVPWNVLKWQHMAWRDMARSCIL